MTLNKSNLPSRMADFLATGFGSGYLPKAPGTWGTVTAIPLYLLMDQWPLWAYLAAVFVCFLVGVQISERYVQRASRADPAEVVWDEIVGFFVTMTLLPPTIPWLILGFVAFRFFDIVKPWPISWSEEYFTGGLAVMIDDVLAGIASCVLLHGIHTLLA